MLVSTGIGETAAGQNWTEAGAEDELHPVGVYEMEATVGDNVVPGRMELIRLDGTLFGKVTFQLGAPLSFGLRGHEGSDGTVEFLTGAPARGMRLEFDGELVTGTLELGPGFPVSGSYLVDEPVPGSVESAIAGLEPHAEGGVSSTDNGDVFPSLTPSGGRIYFGRYERSFAQQSLWMSRIVNGEWSEAVHLPLPSEYSHRAPAVSPDGSMLYFGSTTPLSGTEAATDYNIWMAPIGPNGLQSDPVPLPDGVNSSANDYQPSITDDGTLYFVSERPGGHGDQDIWRAPAVNGGFGPAENLGALINTEEAEMSVYVTPDGATIIFSTGNSREGHLGNEDLYVSHYREGSWTEPRNLGPEVNSFANEYGATLSPDGRYLWFTSDRRGLADIYRVTTSSIGLD